MFRFITNLLEPFCYLIYFIALIIYHRRNAQKGMKILLVYYGAAFLLMTYGSLNVYFHFTAANIWAYHSTALCAAIAIGFYFHGILQTRLKKIVTLGLMSVYILYVAYRTVFARGPFLFDSIGYALVSASIAVYVFLYFHQLLHNVTEQNILKQFNFWLASGYLIYFVGSFLIFISYYYLTKKILATYTKEERDLMTALWGVHNLLLFISAASLLIGSVWLTSRRKSV